MDILRGDQWDWRTQAAVMQAAGSRRCEYLGLSAQQAQRIQNTSLRDLSGLAGQSSAQYGGTLDVGMRYAEDLLYKYW